MKTRKQLIVFMLTLPLTCAVFAVWAGAPRSNPSDVRKLMVDPQATPETVALFFKLKKIAQRGQTLIGQQDPEQSVNEKGGEMAITRIMGSEPAVWGSDFMQITHVANTNATGWFRDTEKKIIGFASAAYDKNMVNIFCWHFQDPYEQKSFMSSELKKETVEKSFRSLLPGGGRSMSGTKGS